MWKFFTFLLNSLRNSVVLCGASNLSLEFNHFRLLAKNFVTAMVLLLLLPILLGINNSWQPKNSELCTPSRSGVGGCCLPTQTGDAATKLRSPWSVWLLPQPSPHSFLAFANGSWVFLCCLSGILWYRRLSLYVDFYIVAPMAGLSLFAHSQAASSFVMH